MRKRQVKQNVLAGHVKTELEEMIINGELKPNERLASEMDLSEMFGVSRATLREALKLMEKDGLITKKNGVGTFVSMPSSLISGRLEVGFSLSDAADAAGMTMETVNVDYNFRPATEGESKRLDLDVGEEVVCFRRRRFMNDKCIALSEDVLSAKALSREEAVKLKNQSLYRFMEKEMGVSIEAGDAELTASIATEVLAEDMGLEVGSPLLRIRQVDYDTKGNPLLYSVEYYNSRRFKFFVKRQRSLEHYALEYFNQ